MEKLPNRQYQRTWKWYTPFNLTNQRLRNLGFIRSRDMEMHQTRHPVKPQKSAACNGRLAISIQGRQESSFAGYGLDGKCLMGGRENC